MMATKQGKARRDETHKPMMAWDPMPTDPLTLVAPASAQALMAKNPEEADEQGEHWETRTRRGLRPKRWGWT